MGHRVGGTQVLKEDRYIELPNRGRSQKITTKVWDILIQCKHESTTWEALKDIKECYFVQLADYAIEKGISNEPCFPWWISKVVKKRNAIVEKVKSKYWSRTDKFGIQILKNVYKDIAINHENHNNLCRNAIAQEMKTVHIAFKEYNKSQGTEPPGYK